MEDSKYANLNFFGKSNEIVKKKCGIFKTFRVKPLKTGFIKFEAEKILLQ